MTMRKMNKRINEIKSNKDKMKVRNKKEKDRKRGRVNKRSMPKVVARVVIFAAVNAPRMLT